MVRKIMSLIINTLGSNGNIFMEKPEASKVSSRSRCPVQPGWQNDKTSVILFFFFSSHKAFGHKYKLD